MGELRVTETFEKGGDTYEEGKTYLVAEGVAEWAEERGCGSRLGKGAGKREIPKLESHELGSVWDELKRKAKSGSDKPSNWNPEKGNWLLGTVERTRRGGS